MERSPGRRLPAYRGLRPGRAGDLPGCGYLQGRPHLAVSPRQPGLPGNGRAHRPPGQADPVRDGRWLRCGRNRHQCRQCAGRLPARPARSPAMIRLKRLLAPFIAAGLVAGALQAHAEQRTLRVYNWFDYITPQTLVDFQKDTQVKLIYHIFDTNEALEAKLLTGNSGYDVVVPSNVFLAKQIEAGVFQPLDRTQLPNWQHLDPALMKLIEANDPGNKFAVPYMYGTVLIGFNPDKVKA